VNERLTERIIARKLQFPCIKVDVAKIKRVIKQKVVSVQGDKDFSKNPEFSLP
jgi:hypothetical protein